MVFVVVRRAKSRPSILATMAVAAILVFAAGWLALYSGRAAFGFLPSLNTEKPALAMIPPVLGHAPPRLAKRVVLFILDGLRLDTSYGRPFLGRLRSRGIDAQADSHFPTLSRPNYTSIATGVEPRWSGVRTNDYKGRVPLDSIMARARAQGLRVSFIGENSSEFPRMFSPELDEGIVTPWPGGIQRSAESALSRGDELVILIFDEIDSVGHALGAASPEYREAVRRVDQSLGALIDKLDFTRDAVVVVADHGHVDKGGHGGLEPEAVTVPLVLAGAGIDPGAMIVGARLIDVAPTIAALLGLPAPGHAFGRTLTTALAIPEDSRRALADADSSRHERLFPIAKSLHEEQAKHAWTMRLSRCSLVVSGLALLLAFTVFAAHRSVVIVDRRVLLIAVPAFPMTFYAMVMTFEEFLSPSMLPGTAPLASKLFVYGGVAALAHLMASWCALTGRLVPRERLAAATGLALVGLLVAVAPAGAAWALAGHDFAIMLPGPRSLLLPPVTASAVCCYALSAAFTLVVEYLVFLARASDPARVAMRAA
ncbi:MAG: alkaline phosphatase family protein [Deltaproteobacteria bacterium]|nr:alkaline phosphatase family protein [Deltaproteobacteria bacterium]